MRQSSRILPGAFTMINSLRILFGFIFLFMIYATIRASLQNNLFEVLPSLLDQPWTVMALYDAYFGFITFYTWVFYKESGLVIRILWFILIMLLGNIAMSVYVLIKLSRLKSGDGFEKLLMR